LSSELQGTLRRLKPDKHRAPLRPRAESDLEFIGTASHRPAKLLYDTTVYIDILQGRFPQQGAAMLRATEAWHSPVTEAELAAICGLLDPAHSQTLEIIRASCCGHRPTAQLPDDHARSRDLAGSWSAFRHAGPDPGIRTRTAASRLKRRAAVRHRQKIRMCGVLPQRSGLRLAAAARSFGESHVLQNRCSVRAPLEQSWQSPSRSLSGPRVDEQMASVGRCTGGAEPWSLLPRSSLS
jgi:hypothetical protein